MFRVFLRISVQIIARILHNLWKRAVTDQHIHLPLGTLNRYEVTCHTGTPHRLSIIPTQNSFKISLPAQNALFPPINKLTSACETGHATRPDKTGGFGFRLANRRFVQVSIESQAPPPRGPEMTGIPLFTPRASRRREQSTSDFISFTGSGLYLYLPHYALLIEEGRF